MKGLEEFISSLDSSLHYDLEAIMGHKSSVVLSVYPRKEKSYMEQLGSFQPVRQLFGPTGHYKFHVFIFQTFEKGTIDLRDKAAVCGECRFVRRRILVLRENRNSMDKNERLQRQQASSKVRLSLLSPVSQKARQDNVKRERKNFRRVVVRIIKRISFTVNEQQNSELVKLIE